MLNPDRRLDCRWKSLSDKLLALIKRKYRDAVQDVMDVVNQDVYGHLTKDDDYTWKQTSGRSLNLPGGGQEVEMDSLHVFLQSGSCFVLKPAVRERNKLLWLAQVDYTWNHSNGRRLNLPGQGQEVEHGSRGKFLASNFRFVNESNRVLGSRPKIWAPNQDKTIKQEDSNADANISFFTCIQTVVLVSSSLMLCAVPWFVNNKKKAINGVASAINNSWLLWPRNMIIWTDIALMVAALASLLALEMKASKPQFARLCGNIATLCLLFAVVLLLSTVTSLVSSVTI